MKPVVSTDANPGRTGKVRKSNIPGPGKRGEESVVEVSPPAGDKPGSGTAIGSHAGKHVYRVGGLRIPTKNSVRGPKSRCAGRVKDLLRKRAESPMPPYSDPTVIEPPIRKPPAPRERHALHDFSSSPRGLMPGRGRFEPEDDAEDLDDE
jgi:hypothetical protein